METDDVDLEISILVKKFCADVSLDEYVDFDAELSTFVSEINLDALDWRQKARIDRVINSSSVSEVVISDEI